MKIGNLKKKNIYIYILFRKKNPQNYHGQLVPNLIFFLFKEKKNTKLSWPMSAKFDTQLPNFIYNEIRIFLDRL